MARVIVEVRGGVAEITLLSGTDVEVLVIDYDVDCTRPDELPKVDGKEALVTLHTPDGFPPRADQSRAFETLWQAGYAAVADNIREQSE